MSANLILAVWAHYPGGGAELNVLQSIAEASNEQGNCYLSVSELAAGARLSRSSALRAIRKLRSARYIVSSRILGRGGKQINQVNLPLLRRCERPGADAVTISASRELGTAEVALVERVALRVGQGCQIGTATEGQSDTSVTLTPRPDAAESASPALEETALSRQEEQEAAAAVSVPFGAGEPEDVSQGAGVPDEASGRAYGPASASFDDEIMLFDPSLDDTDDLAALAAQVSVPGVFTPANRRRGFTPRKVGA